MERLLVLRLRDRGIGLQHDALDAPHRALDVDGMLAQRAGDRHAFVAHGLEEAALAAVGSSAVMAAEQMKTRTPRALQASTMPRMESR